MAPVTSTVASRRRLFSRPANSSPSPSGSPRPRLGSEEGFYWTNLHKREVETMNPLKEEQMQRTIKGLLDSTSEWQRRLVRMIIDLISINTDTLGYRSHLKNL